MKLQDFLMLQLFAEGEESETEGSEGSGTGGAHENEGDSGNGEVSFDDFLKTGKNQDEFDRRVQAAINTALANEKSKWEKKNDEKLTEADRLSKMSAEEKQQYEMQKLQKELADMKRQNALSDMAKTARKMLAGEGINISDELLANLVCEDAVKTKESVEAFSKMFKDAVEIAVKAKLKGEPPKRGTGSGITKKQILDIKDPLQRQEMIAKHIELFQ